MVQLGINEAGGRPAEVNGRDLFQPAEEVDGERGGDVLTELKKRKKWTKL